MTAQLDFFLYKFWIVFFFHITHFTHFKHFMHIYIRMRSIVGEGPL
jgi:hypothetical protein